MKTIIEFIRDIKIRNNLRLLNFFNFKNNKEAIILPIEEYKKNRPN